MNQLKLKNGWIATGSDLSELSAELKELDDAFEIVEFKPEEGYKLVGYAVDQDPDGNEYLVSDVVDPLGGGGMDTYETEGIRAGVMKHWNEDLKEEAFKGGLFFSWPDPSSGDEVFAYADPACLCSINFTGIGGEAMKFVKWPIVNAAMFLLKTKGCKLCIRKGMTPEGNIVRKVLTVRSLQYMDVRQYPMLELTEEICKNGELTFWSVDQDFTEANFSFSNLGVEREIGGKKIVAIPKIRFYTSDSGRASLAWKLGWTVNGRTVFLSPGKCEVIARHKGEWTNKKSSHIKNCVVKLFEKTEDLIKKIDELDKIEIYYGEAQTVLTNLMEDNEPFKRMVRKEIRDAIIEESLTRFTDPVHTAAELVLFLQETADRINNLLPSTMFQIREACGEFFYMKIRKDAGLGNK